MKVSLIQTNSQSDKAANIAAAKELMERAISEEHPDLLVLPETFDFVGGTPAEKLRAGESVPGGPAYSMCQEVARAHGVFVHAGSLVEKVPSEDKVHNTTAVFDRSGREVARYRKIHLFDIVTPDGLEYKESATVKPGNAVVTYNLEGLTVGCSICYDLRFPELFQALVRKGSQVIALPACFTLQTGKDHWEVLCRPRSVTGIGVAHPPIARISFTASATAAFSGQKPLLSRRLMGLNFFIGIRPFCLWLCALWPADLPPGGPAE